MIMNKQQIKQKLEGIKTIVDEVTVLLNEEEVPVAVEPTPQNKLLIVDTAGTITDLAIPDDIDRVHFSNIDTLLGLRAATGKVIEIKYIGNNSMNILFDGSIPESDRFNFSRWINTGSDGLYFKKTTKGWNNIEGVNLEPAPAPIPQPKPTPPVVDPGTITYPEPNPEDSTSTEGTENFSNLPYLPFAELFGRDTQAFKSMLGQVGEKLEHFYLKGKFEIVEDLILPQNIKFSFDYDAQILFKNSETQIHSRIHADERSYIFKVEGEKKPSIYPTACNEVSFYWFGVSAQNAPEINDVSFETAIYCSHLNGAFVIPFESRDSPIKTSKTIEFVSYNRPNQMVFPAWKVKGRGVGSGRHHDEASSCIKYLGKSGPAMNIRGSRFGTVIEDFNLIGINEKPNEIFNSGILNTTALWEVKNWLSEGVSIDRYDALTGIAFDWVDGQGNSFPWSAQSTVRNVQIARFVVGLNISPNSGGYQADTIIIDACRTYQCVFGASIGQDQARAVTFRDCIMEKSFCFFTNRKFGKGNGSLFNIRGGQYTTALKAFDVQGQFGGNCDFSGAYFEAIGCIGSLNSTGVNSNGIVFTGCDFLIDDDGYTNPSQAGRWAAPYLCVQGGSNITFIGGTIRPQKRYLGLDSGVNGRFNFIGVGFGDIENIQLDAFSVLSKQSRLSIEGCTWAKTTLDFNNVPSVSRDKKYVRWSIDSYKNFYGDGSVGGTGIKTVLTQGYNISDDWGNNALPQDTERVFTVNLHNAMIYRKGDYVTGLLKGDIDGMGLGLGQLDPPCLEVLEVNGNDGNDVTFGKLGPEVDISLDNNRWGRVWAVNKCWISGSLHEEVIGVGDWFNDDNGSNRIGSNGNPLRSIVGKVRGR